MAEIRSTLDIVMEKTKGLRMTDEEKERFWEEGISQRANGLCVRYLDGHMEWEDIEKEILKGEAREIPILKKALLTHLVNSIRLSALNDRAMNAIDLLTTGREKENLKRINDLISIYLKTKKKREKRLRADLWAELEKIGISGSAVLPNVEDNPKWKAMESEIETEFNKKLQELKERLNKAFI
jgi:hypothetical protein